MSGCGRWSTSHWRGAVNRDNQAAFNGSMRRYLNACKMLAIVQRLNLPSIQVNIAEQQVVANG